MKVLCKSKRVSGISLGNEIRNRCVSAILYDITNSRDFNDNENYRDERFDEIDRVIIISGEYMAHIHTHTHTYDNDNFLRYII